MSVTFNAWKKEFSADVAQGVKADCLWCDKILFNV
jgi:hypothetical protein